MDRVRRDAALLADTGMSVQAVKIKGGGAAMLKKTPAAKHGPQPCGGIRR